ncbi:methyl-accepting chemotaxis protein [Paenibacillus cremeus]|uniref:Methyl-accepting transducer domain-containing protein n=1 Tax=Paenibacillus cremeus TaxID=2163881 RepID=A0A559K9Z8_9BACL|nr:methyl-accepting chemotaxis protein [Paenibacillus cremeus]TVY08955.1 hypothetical protein FPZ49_15835 [Paenibacillus cremeus]
MAGSFYTPVTNSSGSVQAVIKIASNITERQTVLESSTQDFIHVVAKMTANTNEVYAASQSIMNDMAILDRESDVVKKNVEEIQKVTAFVEDVAARSNLLGLNAAIESARAGVHGRGFNVVANEIRKMADSSKESAASISKQLGDIQKSVFVMVELVAKVNEKTHRNYVSINELKTAYEQIASTADNPASFL